MTAVRRLSISGFVVAAWLSASAAAFAQVAAQQQPVNQGPMTLERIHSGWVVGPEIKATDMDHEISPLMGVSGGYLYDDTFFVGGAGYWLLNGDHDRGLAYGGAVIGWHVRPHGRFGVGTRALIGGGSATLDSVITQTIPGRVEIDPRTGRPIASVARPGTTTTFRVVTYEDFFVFEPEANVSFAVARGVRLTGGIGYRVVGSAHGLDDRIRGTTGTVSLQIGGGN